ncbi:MAG: biotin synthase BioB [Thermaceae bacterium]
MLDLVDRALLGLKREDLEVLLEKDPLELAQAAIALKERVFGKKIRLNRLSNIKSGRCPEDCAYCAQSVRWSTSISIYPLLPTEKLLEEAEEARRLGAKRFCMVSATRQATPSLLRRMEEAVPRIKALGLEVCNSLGFLTEEAAQRLKAAGVDYYNHNLNTSRSHYPRIASTHTYQDRLNTLEIARKAGLKLCSGVILGLGEGKEDILELLSDLQRLAPESVPVNFLLPIPGTPLGRDPDLRFSPSEALKYLSLFRLALPRAELRASAGRERYFGPYLPLALQMVNSIFIQGYLTQKGAPLEEDLALLNRLGLQIEN